MVDDIHQGVHRSPQCPPILTTTHSHTHTHMHSKTHQKQILQSTDPKADRAVRKPPSSSNRSWLQKQMPSRSLTVPTADIHDPSAAIPTASTMDAVEEDDDSLSSPPPESSLPPASAPFSTSSAAGSTTRGEVGPPAAAVANGMHPDTPPAGIHRVCCFAQLGGWFWGNRTLVGE